MDEKLIRFFDKIKFNDIAAFEDATFKEMSIKKSDNTWSLKIEAKEIINLESMLKLLRICSSGVDDVKQIFIQMNYLNLDPDKVLEYFSHYFMNLINENPSLSGITDDNIHIDDEVIIINLTSKIEETILKKECKKIMKKLEELGITGFEVSFVVDDTESQKIREQIEKEKDNVVIPKRYEPVEDKPKWQMRKNRILKRWSCSYFIFSSR